MLSTNQIVENVRKYEETVNMLIEHEETCETCTEWLVSADNDVNQLKCAFGWTKQYELRLIGEKIDKPENFVA